MGATALRSFFMTTGSHIGTGPPEMRSSNTIIIMLGGRVPFYIRSNGAEFGQSAILVRDVYVHGLIDREGMLAN
jgi:hypothetical protein